MRPYYLLLFILVAASYPQLHADISFGDDVTITNFERLDREDPTQYHGDWRMLLLDDEGLILSETRFDPVILTPMGEELVEELTVPIRAHPQGKTLHVINAEGRLVAEKAVPEICGNGFCAEHERLSCPDDCPLEYELEQQESLLEPIDDGDGWFVWGIAASILLIIVLILVMIHLNRRKPDPVQIDTGYQYR